MVVAAHLALRDHGNHGNAVWHPISIKAQEAACLAVLEVGNNKLNSTDKEMELG